MYINNLGHMTKMAAMSIYSKNPSIIFFSRTGGGSGEEEPLGSIFFRIINIQSYCPFPARLLLSMTF